MIDWDILKETLDETQYKVLELFLKDKQSIRDITQIVGLGRTKVGNILKSCIGLDAELDKEIELRKLNLRTHKNAIDASEIDLTPLTDEDISFAYVEMMEGGSTLTEVAAVLGKQRDTVKKAIIEWLEGDKEAEKEFRQVLKDNQSGSKEARYFRTADEEEKKAMIFNKLNNRRKLSKKGEYPISMLEKKYERLAEYFEKRNDRMVNEADKISRDDLLAMLYDYPSMLGLSLSDKIRPIIGKLDEKYLGESNTSKVLKENPGIIGTTLTRIRLQVNILKDSGTLDKAIAKPRIFRTSPELLYAEIAHWKEVRPGLSSPFMCRSRLQEVYRKTAEEIMEAHDVREVYGTDEYFDGR